MCACGDLHPSFVCSKHRDTRDDPAWWLEGDPPHRDQVGWDEQARAWMAQQTPVKP